jgi:hypothetical protein
MNSAEVLKACRRLSENEEIMLVNDSTRHCDTPIQGLVSNFWECNAGAVEHDVQVLWTRLFFWFIA